MKQLQSDIALIEGDNELNVQMVPVVAEAWLYGSVYDRGTGPPMEEIPGVTVTIEGKTATTGLIGTHAGRYVIYGLTAGRHKIIYSKAGYETWAPTITLEEGKNLGNAYLTPIAPTFDPWSYDFNGNGYIDSNEVMAATNDYFAGKITKSEVDQVTYLWQNNIYRWA